MARGRFVALLRGINVGGRNKLPMAELRALAAGLGWRDVGTYIQSGNVAFTASGTETALERRLEAGIAERFDLTVPVIVRSAERLRRYPERNPFADAAAAEPNHVLLGLSKAKPARGALQLLEQRAVPPERVAIVGDGLWIHYASGVARSKLTPALLDRAVGSTVTARNVRTLRKLVELVRAPA